jgi:hypothetical protein
MLGDAHWLLFFAQDTQRHTDVTPRPQSFTAVAAFYASHQDTR